MHRDGRRCVDDDLFPAGARVKSDVEQLSPDHVVRVRKDAQGTFWAQSGTQAFVIWDQRVGASPPYPAVSDAPPGKRDYAYWVYLWEISPATGRIPSTIIPQWCGQSTPYVFGAVKKGSFVVLGRHSEVDGDDNWTPMMDPFVGRVAQVTKAENIDVKGCPTVRVTIDKGSFSWRIRNMKLATMPPPVIPTTTPTTMPTTPPRQLIP
jgi:hypothetical protein